ncbi:hypothetical protein JCM6882_002878 [Rhodosporidiobolus microsporus]
MRSLASLSFLAIIASGAVALRQPYQYLAALQRFQEEFLNPQATVEAGRSPSLADDCVGRVDVTTTFEGQELNTEYLFGLFYNIRGENATSIIGFPSSQEIQTLIVEPPIVYFSGILHLSYPTINKTIPAQIDVITAWNDDLKIISYDASFRRWPHTFAYIVEQVAPQIAKELNEPFHAVSTNRSALLAKKAAVELCETAMNSCTGDNKQYESYDECYRFLTEERPWGGSMDGGLDTTWCRYVHRNMVPFRPDVHCSHIGPSGGDMCIQRDYLEVTTAFPFKQTLVAPNVTWDDRDMGALSEKSVSELGKVKLTLNYPTTIPFFSVPTFTFFLLLWLSAKVVEGLLFRYSAEYKLLGAVNQRNTVTYFLNAFYTTIALGLQLVAAPALVRSYTQLGVQCITVTSCMIAALYVFEMVYRESLRPSLLAHHLCTLLAIISLFVSIENSYHPATVTVGVIWLFQATTEQSIFVALIMYRLKLNARLTLLTLRFAAVQSFICKFAFAVYLLVFHSLYLVQFTSLATDVYFSVIVYTVGLLLLTTQAYGSWAVWAISLKLAKQLTAGSDGVASSGGLTVPGSAARGFSRLGSSLSLQSERKRSSTSLNTLAAEEAPREAGQ